MIGTLGAGAQLAADRRSRRCPGSREVEQDDVGLRRLQRRRAGRDSLDGEAFTPQPLSERLGDRVLVFDEQHVHGLMVARATRARIGVLRANPFPTAEGERLAIFAPALLRPCVPPNLYLRWPGPCRAGLRWLDLPGGSRCQDPRVRDLHAPRPGTGAGAVALVQSVQLGQRPRRRRRRRRPRPRPGSPSATKRSTRRRSPCTRRCARRRPSCRRSPTSRPSPRRRPRLPRSATRRRPLPRLRCATSGRRRSWWSSIASTATTAASDGGGGGDD